MIDKNSTKAEVLEAVKQDGWALEYASEDLRGDRDVVLEAVKQDRLAFCLASVKLKYEMAECWARLQEGHSGE